MTFPVYPSCLRKCGCILLLCILLFQSATLANTFVVSNAADSGAGSLRQAILDANANSGEDIITFHISGSGAHSIMLSAALPTITDPLTIDGTTQTGFAGFPLIELNGINAGNNAGLRITAGHCVVRGLVINRFSGDGIRMEGAGTNIIAGNFIGTDLSGSLGRGNGQQGVLSYLSFGNVIGGTNSSDRNLISGNGDNGIYLYAGGMNLVQGNQIGTGWNGTNVIGNTNNGVAIYGSVDNLIGGKGALGRNLISGNHGSGIYVNTTASTSNRIQGNYIGTVLSGKAAAGNLADGITLLSAVGNRVGGTNTGDGNLISGNAKAGISLSGVGNSANVFEGNLIGTDATGRAAIGNALAGIWMWSVSSNLVGSLSNGGGNVISGNRQDGIFILTNSVGNQIVGNLIGVDESGTNALPNLFNGISLTMASSNLVGGVGPEARNVISGNANHGIQLGAGAAANQICGNYVGTDYSGTKAVANSWSGIRIESQANVIGDAVFEAGNLISGNGEDGIYLVGAGARSNHVQANFIGTTVGGSERLGNGRAGVGISSAPDNVIGGTAKAAGNLISGNADAGIYLVGSGSVGNEVLGNMIGADVSGTTALGNAYEGIYLEGATSNILGGSIPGSGNQISGNGTRGIYLTNASWNSIQGNLLGTSADGLNPLPNTFHNLECDSGANHNLIGGIAAAANRIAWAPAIYCGVRIRDNSVGNQLSRNLIFSNGGLGIDLGTAGISFNDPCDGDSGGNLLQNYPVLTQVVSAAGTAIRGVMNGTPNSTFLLQFFANATCHNSGHGEGQIYLGDAQVVLGPQCTSNFRTDLPVRVPAGFAVTATATDAAGNTSEFSACTTVQEGPRLTVGISADHKQLELMWPSSASGFLLQKTFSLDEPIHWEPVTNATIDSGGRWLLTVPMTWTNAYYGLTLE